MRRAGVALIAALLVAVLGVASVVGSTLMSPPRLFRRNAELKASGYYMAEFEFKMLAVLYHLNEGSYIQAYRTLRRIEREMETLEGLVKVPAQATQEELIQFSLQRQNAETGAFMDPAYPFFTFIAPTANVLGELGRLAVKANRPITLRHPLRFLDQIRTVPQLRAYLSSLLYIDERWAEMFDAPAPYVAGVSELQRETVSLFEHLGGYQFSNEWKEALTAWYHETQDPVTGFWGARIGDEADWRQSLDIDSTSHIIAHFLGERGETLDSRYPLRHVEPLARTLLEQGKRRIPGGPVEQHEWSLRQGHTAKIITRWLWPALSARLRDDALQAMPEWLEDRFLMYRPEQGGFAVDSTSPSADIDATTTALTFLQNVGFIPATWERERLRGEALVSEPIRARFVLARWEDAAVAPHPGLNSLRVYAGRMPGEDWDDTSLMAIVYPRATRVRDVMDLRQGLARYVASEGGEFGNWTTKASLRDRPLALKRAVRAVPSSTGSLDLGSIARAYAGEARFFVVGLDRFQVPIFVHEYLLAEPP